MAKARRGGRVVYVRKDGTQKEPEAVKKLIRPEPSPHEIIIVKTEDKARYNKTEKMSVVDSQGNVVYQSRGGKASVSFDQRVIPPGAVVTHNHPTGGKGDPTTFSEGDVSAFVSVDNIAELRATDQYGAYILRKKNPGPDSKKFANEFAKHTSNGWKEYNSKARELQRIVNQRQLSAADANKELGSMFKNNIQAAKQWLTKNAAKYGYEYDYRPHGGKVK